MTALTQNEEHAQVLRVLRKRFAGPAEPFVAMAIDAAIAALEREGQHPQPSLDLEPVRRLIEAVRVLDDTKPVDRPHSWRAWQVVSSAIQRGVPALRSLLAEIESYREAKLPPDGPRSVVHRIYHEQVVGDLRVENERLREENTRLKEAQHGTSL